MSEQNMDPKKRNIIIGCSVAGAVVVNTSLIATFRKFVKHSDMLTKRI